MTIRKAFVITSLIFAYIVPSPALATTLEEQDAMFDDCTSRCTSDACYAACYTYAYGSETSGGGQPNQYPVPPGDRCTNSFNGTCRPN